MTIFANLDGTRIPRSNLFFRRTTRRGLRGKLRLLGTYPLLLLVLALGSSAGVLYPVSGQQGTSALPQINPKAEQLISQAIQVLGGTAFLQAKTLTTTGRIFAMSEGVTAGFAPFKSFVEYPDKSRFSYGAKKPVTLINNGGRAWELDRYGLTSQLPEQRVHWQLSNRYSLESLLRLRIHDPDVLIQDGGVDFVDNLPLLVIDILESNGDRVKLYLHQQNLLPMRITYKVLNPKTREWDEYAAVYGDYQRVQNIQTPMHITRIENGQRVTEIFRNTARYNETYPADYFEPTG